MREKDIKILGNGGDYHENLIIEFCLDYKVDKTILKNIVKSIESTDSWYDRERGFYTGIESFGETSDEPLEKGIELITQKKYGLIPFDSEIIHFDLQFYRERILQSVSLSLHSGNFNPRYPEYGVSVELAKKRAEHIINVAKAIWNALKVKPIYGVGGLTGEHLPTEEDILNLNLTPRQISDYHLPTKRTWVTLLDPINNYWLNFYGPKLLEKYDKEKILTHISDPGKEEIFSQEGKKVSETRYKKPKKPFWKSEDLEDGLLTISSPLPKYFMDREELKKLGLI